MPKSKTSKNKRKFLSKGFFAGLLIGITITSVGILAYYKFTPPVQKFPPTNSVNYDPNYESCNSRCLGHTGDLLGCTNTCKTCKDSCDNNLINCSDSCQSGDNECLKKCGTADTACISSCYKNIH